MPPQACFSCRECGHCLDYSNCIETSFTFKGVVFVAEANNGEAAGTAPTGDVYCKACHARAFSAGGRNRFGDATVNSKIAAGEGDESRCPRCAGKVFEAERMKTSAGSFHPACFKCARCAATLDYAKVFCSEGDVYCGPCYKEDFGVASRRTRPRSKSA